jgi:hypothetical protein
MKHAAQAKPPRTHSHQWLDAVDVQMCRAIAEKIRRKPGLMSIPRANLRRWKRKIRPWPRAFQEWEEILARNSIERVLEILTQDNDEGQRLRQSDPFAGVLTEEERCAFLKFDEPDAA